MRGARARVELVAPGLLGPFPGQASEVLPIPEVPALERVLARGAHTRDRTGGLEPLLFELFGMPPVAPSRLPVAPLTRWVDTGERDNGPWVRADPVHLRADQQQLLLFDNHVLAISEDEAQRLIDGLNELLTETGARVDAPSPARWYLRVDETSGLAAAPLPEVAGRPVASGPPADAPASRWRAWLTEVQMWFHDHPVNAEREAHGRPTINSLWLWGAGELPAGPDASQWDSVISDEPLARGLARTCGCAQRPLPDCADAWIGRATSGRHLVVLEAARGPALYGDVEAWMTAVDRLEREWIAPLVAALRGGRIGELALRGADGRRWRLSRLRARLPARRGVGLAGVATETP